MARSKGTGNKETGSKATGIKATTAESIDSLYQLPLAEFTPARNALAAKLRKSGRADEADGIKSLVKPSIPAWAVNQVYWKHRDAFDRLIASGDRLRKAQASTLAGKSGDVRAALDAVRQALSELSRLASDALTVVGHNPSPGVMRAVTATLEALSAYGSTPNAPGAGRLVDEVDPPGFETLAALVPNAAGASGSDVPSRILRFRQDAHPPKPSRRQSGENDEKRAEEARQAKLAAAKAAAQDADQTLRELRTAAQQAQAALTKAGAHAKDTEKAMVDAEAVMERTAKEAHSARQTARRLAVEAEAAAQAVEDAERAVTRAKKELEDLK